MSELVMRTEYINFLRRHGDKQVIKVVSGVRRAGKSTLFKLFQDELLSEGVKQSQIIAINLYKH
ncbi:AAA family ATPase [Macrococcoides bohemicum]|uniref:AAA family ATPase n=1 Tax=Macrococcoides bohemicum TaxID=1903056 RepID=UPI00165E6F98|nr:AAA family ATPase [Macrococcus bohemicus]MBC9874943.1 AAA family ATPase [Macrococcus bohemicus]